MTTNKILEGFACFVERLPIAVSPFSERNNVLILESDPEPGYFSRNGFPENLAHANDHHLYLLTQKPITCFQDWIIQQACIAKNRYGINIRVSPGQLIFKNKAHNCIRMRTQEVDNVKRFVDFLKEQDVKFIKHTSVKPFESLVHFKKHIEIRSVGNGVYADLHDKNRHFVKIPVLVDFEEFEKIVKEIKNNCNFSMFNAAQVSMTRREKVINFIAIYSKDCDENRLPEFKKFVDKHFNVG